MTATQVQETEKTELASGRVARVIGPVVDVEFPAHAIPARSKVRKRFSVRVQHGSSSADA